MEQRLRTWAWGAVAVMALLLPTGFLSSCSSKETNTSSMTAITNNAAGGPKATVESQKLARQIQELKQIPLPDEWYPAKGASLAERFEATAQAMRGQSNQAPATRELIARYENNGQPFAHTVWLNQPLPCRKCTQAGAGGFHAVASVRRGLTVTVSAAEMHEVTNHQGSFPNDKLELLKKILSPD